MSENPTPVAVELRDVHPLENAVGWAMRAEQFARTSENLRVAAVRYTADTPAQEIAEHDDLMVTCEIRMGEATTMAHMWASIASAASNSHRSNWSIGELGGFSDSQGESAARTPTEQAQIDVVTFINEHTATGCGTVCRCGW